MQKKISFWLIIQLNSSCISRPLANKQEGSFHFISVPRITSGLCGASRYSVPGHWEEGTDCVPESPNHTFPSSSSSQSGSFFTLLRWGAQESFCKDVTSPVPCYLPEIIFSIWWLMFENASVEGLPHGFWWTLVITQIDLIERKLYRGSHFLMVWVSVRAFPRNMLRQGNRAMSCSCA